MMTGKYNVISLLLLLAILAGCQNDSEETTEETTESQNIDNEQTEEEADEDSEAVSENTSEEHENSGETDSEKINQTIEKAEEIDSYEAVVNLVGDVDGSAYNLNAEVTFKDGNPPNLLLESDGEARTVAKNGSIYIYSGDDWVETTESMNIESLFLVTYDSTINSFENLSGNLTQEETDEAYVFNYKGTNQTVYQEFESLLGFEFGALDTSDVHSDLTFTVSKDDHLLESIDYVASGEDEQGEYSLNGEVDFTSFNDVGEIELPEEIEQ